MCYNFSLLNLLIYCNNIVTDQWSDPHAHTQTPTFLKKNIFHSFNMKCHHLIFLYTHTHKCQYVCCLFFDAVCGLGYVIVKDLFAVERHPYSLLNWFIILDGEWNRPGKIFALLEIGEVHPHRKRILFFVHFLKCFFFFYFLHFIVDARRETWKIEKGLDRCIKRNDNCYELLAREILRVNPS